MIRFECPYCNRVMGLEMGDLGSDMLCPSCQEIISIPHSRLAPRFVFGDFIFQRKVASWKYGKIFSAWQVPLQRSVAIKILAPEFSSEIFIIQEFANEARKDSQLDYPHIGQIFHLGEESGLYYCAMENVEVCNDTNTAIFMQQIVVTNTSAISKHDLEHSHKGDGGESSLNHTTSSNSKREIAIPEIERCQEPTLIDDSSRQEANVVPLPTVTENRTIYKARLVQAPSTPNQSTTVKQVSTTSTSDDVDVKGANSKAKISSKVHAVRIQKKRTQSKKFRL